MSDHPEAIAVILDEDLVIPAGTRFDVGPVRTEYGEGHYQAILPISDDETFSVSLFMDRDLMEKVTFLYP